MARPAMNVETSSKHFTKEEIKKRKEVEDRLKGGVDKIKPPTYLSKNQKVIFKFIVKELKASEILCNLDIYVLTNCAIAIDRVQEAEKLLDKDILNKDALRVKDSYNKEFFRYCNELSLSPQARAKIGSLKLNTEAEKVDPLVKALEKLNNDKRK